MARRSGKAWVGGVGWVSKKTTETRKYDDYQNACGAFFIWTLRWFPDKLMDILRSDHADYKNEEILQRVMMRAFARYQSVTIFGGRGITKTSTKFKYQLVNGLVWPGTQSSYYGPSYTQMAPIGSKAFRQIEHDYPLLASMWRVSAESKDDFKIETDLGSAFYISAFRGDNIHDVTAEEYAQEEAPAFDYQQFGAIVLPAVRLWHSVQGEPDENYVGYKKHIITSACRKQNHAFSTRCKTMQAMLRGESAFAMDVSWESVVLQLMRPYEWSIGLKDELTVEQWMREMESRCTGASEFPVISDDSLTDSQNLMCMEKHHALKYPGAVGQPEDFIYIVGYDVSYEDSKKNAKCACVVLKCSRQKAFLKRDKFLKQMVYIDDWPPPDNSMIQARKLKEVWYRFCLDGGAPTYISIDGWQYGKAVVEDLMTDLGDGLPPLCIRDHADYVSAELPGALPVIYPIKAGGNGVTDPDFEMIKYAQMQFDNHNVELLTTNVREGVEAYKRKNRIKDDYQDYMIAQPYQKSRELAGQIQNLKLKPSGSGMSELRISLAIQRDSWSALKYALRLAQKIEREELLNSIQQKSSWEEELQKYKDAPVIGGSFARSGGRLVAPRSGGRRR